MSDTRINKTLPAMSASALLCAGAVLGGMVMGLAGCRGEREDAPPRQFFPDLDDQPKWRPQNKSGFYADGRTMRQPVAGTVAFSRTAFVVSEEQMEQGKEWARPFMVQRDDLLRADGRVYDGVDGAGKYIERIAVPVTKELLERGQSRFNIYCAVCHGYAGDGKGMVGQAWSYALPNFHDDKYKKPDPANPDQQLWKDGYIFHVARYGVIGGDGKQKMPGYGHALSERDAWAVVAYFRALQETREARLTDPDIPETERQTLERMRVKSSSAGTSGGPTASTAGTEGGAR